jgi:hypothetical protein
VGSVALEPSGALALDALFVTPLDVAGRVQVAVLGRNRTGSALEATLVLTLVAPGGSRTTAIVAVDVPGGPVRADLEAVVASPALWWDAAFAERGGQPLYELEVSAVVARRVSARRVVRFGIRVAEFPAEPRWHYVLNGVPAFVRAVNYVPVQHWATLGEDFYARDFALMKEAHVHAAGVHAHVQSPACYRAADRAGVSLVQDFPLQWSYASGTSEDPTFVPRATAMAAEMACLLWNHPSVVAYTAHNEPVHALREMVGRGLDAKARTAGPLTRLGVAAGRAIVNRALFPMRAPDDPARDSGNRCLDRALVRTIAAVDPSRFVHEAAGAGHDIHVYTGTIGGGRVSDVGDARAPFVSEYGSFPIARRAHGRHDAWATPWPPGPLQIQALCRQGFIAYEALGAAGDITRFKDLPDLASALERKAAFVAKYQTEFFRIHRDDPYTGCRWHFFVNYWGYMGGGLLDVDRAPTAAYHALAAALRPRLAAVLLPETVVPLGPLRPGAFAMNDRLGTWEAAVDWRLARLAWCDVIRGGPTRGASRLAPVPAGAYVVAGLEGSAVADAVPAAEGRFTAACPANGTVRLGEIDLGTLAAGPYAVTLSWLADGVRQQNTTPFLVTRRGWSAPPGLTRVTPDDVA